MLTVSIILIAALVVYILVSEHGDDQNEKKWCRSIHDNYYRCHLEDGHGGQHQCDDYGDKVFWL